MPDLPTWVQILPALALAAGLDLHLVLVLLAASPLLGWAPPLPGELPYLGSPGLVVVAGGFYLLEGVLERLYPAELVWRLFQAGVRPVAAALLAVLLVGRAEPRLVLAAAVVAATLALVTHGVRSGAALLQRWQERGVTSRVLQALAEDVLVVALVAAVLFHPPSALVAGGAVLVGVLVLGGLLRIALFGVRLLWGASAGALLPVRWLTPERFPGWMKRRLARGAVVTGGRLRAARVGVTGASRGGRFDVGWLVVRGPEPLLAHRSLRGVRTSPLPGDGRVEIRTGALEHRVRVGQQPATLLVVPLDGPTAEQLWAELEA